jgi:hypothetical protein
MTNNERQVLEEWKNNCYLVGGSFSDADMADMIEDLLNADTNSTPELCQDDGWIPNNGQQPVRDDMIVDVNFFDGRIEYGVKAIDRYWGHIEYYRVSNDSRTDRVPFDHKEPNTDSSGYSRNLVDQMYKAMIIACDYLPHEDYDLDCPACAVRHAIEAYEAEAKDTKNDR